MHRLARPFLILLVLLLLGLFPRQAKALTVPEKLFYELSWTGVKAGSAAQEIVAEGDELKIVSTARSADWISAFYPIEDRIESTVRKKGSAAMGPPLRYSMKIREGKHRRDKEILFDNKQEKAYYTDKISGEKRVIGINDQTYDIYSSFYQIRFAPLEVGKSVFVSILDGKGISNLQIKVLRKERLKTRLGEFSTFLLNPLVKKEGIFENKGDLLIWVTDDARRLPVKIQAKVLIGRITGILTEVR